MQQIVIEISFFRGILILAKWETGGGIVYDEVMGWHWIVCEGNGLRQCTKFFTPRQEQE